MKDLRKIKKTASVLVALSGGVDSTASLFLLKKAGLKAGALFLKMREGDCQQIEHAKKIADFFDIALHVRDISMEFQTEVIDYFVNSYQLGLTPNPCVICNPNIKIRHLRQSADDLGYDLIATGHYARINSIENGEKTTFRLCKAKDKNKDQSYFLYRLSQADLQCLLFPVGGWLKPALKNLLKKNHVPMHKHESQDVCFLKDDGRPLSVFEFLSRKINLQAGDIIENGRVIGRHHGLPAYTWGQRKGLKIGGTGPYYVSGFDFKANQLIVVKKNSDFLNNQAEIIISDPSWIQGQPPTFPFKCRASIRYQQDPIPCVIERKSSGRFGVSFKKIQRAPTPGQSLVIYHGQEVIGGGIIMKI